MQLFRQIHDAKHQQAKQHTRQQQDLLQPAAKRPKIAGMQLVNPAVMDKAPQPKPNASELRARLAALKEKAAALEELSNLREQAALQAAQLRATGITLHSLNDDLIPAKLAQAAGLYSNGSILDDTEELRMDLSKKLAEAAVLPASLQEEFGLDTSQGDVMVLDEISETEHKLRGADLEDAEDEDMDDLDLMTSLQSAFAPEDLGVEDNVEGLEQVELDPAQAETAEAPCEEAAQAGEEEDDDAGEPWVLEDVGLEGLASSFPLEQMELDADALDGLPDGLEQEVPQGEAAHYAGVEQTLEALGGLVDQSESVETIALGEPGEPTDADDLEAVNVAEYLALNGMAEEGEEEEEEEEEDYDPFSTEPMAA